MENRKIKNQELCMATMPYVLSTNGNRERVSDIFSYLLEERIVFLTEEINDTTASLLIAQLLYLDHQDSTKDIHMYIASPGGSVSAGLAIYDTMQHLKCDVSTLCIGAACSMGSFLLAGGAHGKRFILPNAEVMIHQPLGGTQGQASDIKIAAEHILKTKDRLNRILAENTDKSIEQIAIDTDRDNWLSAEEAVEYGLVDKIL